ncbi:MAG TPA: response regulator [Usitatibacter sp.]|jgi:CheY-like chemotaxis protein|nr:response regulator [Usitatibacter sp.]
MEEPRRILVIDDDPILRELLADWLLAAGYRVSIAGDGGAGIAESRAHRPALVVTDINMPGLGGAAVIAELARLYPGLPVIAISGHFRSARAPLTPEGAIALGAARAFAKPFARKEMVDAVAELAGPAAA